LKIAAPEFAAAESALARVLTMAEPADAVLSRFFRANPQLGQRDRGFVAESVFGVLRRRYALEYETGADTARRLLVLYLNRVTGLSLRQLEPLVGTEDAHWAAALKGRVETDPPLHVAAELPAWLTALLEAEMPADEILALGRALQEPAALDLRVNTVIAARDDILEQLRAGQIAAAPTPHSPLGIRLAGKPAINRHQLFSDGAIEVQDEGSQLVCQLVGAKRREMIVDFCAGAGGKTLALGAAMHSQGRLYAFDTSDARLNLLKPRLKRSQLSNVYPQLIAHENDARVKRLAGKIDRVLVDAPCSGFGTLRRNPDLKWRQSEASVARLEKEQRSILAAASELVKPGGRLVYATCSFLRRENEDIVGAFLDAHPAFSLVPVAGILQQLGIALDTGPYLKLYPHRHGCDGFFAAVLVRSSAVPAVNRA
jgi:16S rRNA (cytosine967-C5)-methyltransferase